METAETEVYKDILGYNGIYKVSNLGNVESLTKKDGRLGRILKQESIVRNVTTYKRVTLSKDGVTQRFQVHRLVAAAFIPNPHDKPQVNHIDFNGSNNNLSNLEWVTRSENERHSLDNNPIKQETLAQRHRETTERMRNEQITRLDNWKNVTLGYAEVVDYEIVDKTAVINMLCKSCGSYFTYRGLTSLRRGLNNQKPLACKGCSTKLKNPEFRPKNPYLWNTKPGLIDKKYAG